MQTTTRVGQQSHEQQADDLESAAIRESLKRANAERMCATLLDAHEHVRRLLLQAGEAFARIAHDGSIADATRLGEAQGAVEAALCYLDAAVKR